MKKRFCRRLSLISGITLGAIVMFKDGIKGVKNGKIGIMSQGLILTRFFARVDLNKASKLGFPIHQRTVSLYCRSS